VSEIDQCGGTAYGRRDGSLCIVIGRCGIEKGPVDVNVRIDATREHVRPLRVDGAPGFW
jgi:hypothetical protein